MNLHEYNPNLIYETRFSHVKYMQNIHNLNGERMQREKKKKKGILVWGPVVMLIMLMCGKQEQ